MSLLEGFYVVQRKDILNQIRLEKLGKNNGYKFQNWKLIRDIETKKWVLSFFDNYHYRILISKEKTIRTFVKIDALSNFMDEIGINSIEISNTDYVKIT